MRPGSVVRLRTGVSRLDMRQPLSVKVRVLHWYLSAAPAPRPRRMSGRGGPRLVPPGRRGPARDRSLVEAPDAVAREAVDPVLALVVGLFGVGPGRLKVDPVGDLAGAFEQRHGVARYVGEVAGNGAGGQVVDVAGLGSGALDAF